MPILKTAKEGLGLGLTLTLCYSIVVFCIGYEITSVVCQILSMLHSSVQSLRHNMTGQNVDVCDH